MIVQTRTSPQVLRVPALIFKGAFPCIFLLTAMILLAHGQSDPTSDLREFLLPSPNCAAPCFMGIRLGVTSLDDAITHLKTDPLIESVTNFSPGRYDLEFAYPLASMPSARMPLLLEAQHGIVERINLYDPGIVLSRIVLVLGQPAQFILNDTLHQGFVTYIGFYPQYLIYVKADLPLCSLDVSSFWKSPQPAAIGIETAQKYTQQLSYYPADLYQTEDGWLRQLHNLKQTDCA